MAADAVWPLLGLKLAKCCHSFGYLVAICYAYPAVLFSAKYPKSEKCNMILEGSDFLRHLHKGMKSGPQADKGATVVSKKSSDPHSNPFIGFRASRVYSRGYHL